MKIHVRKIQPIEILVLASYALVLISVLLKNSWDSELSAFGLLMVFIGSLITLYRLRYFTFILWPLNIVIGAALGVMIKLSGTAPYVGSSNGAIFPVDIAPLAQRIAFCVSGVVLIYLIFTFFWAKKDFFKSTLLIVLSGALGWLVMYSFILSQVSHLA